MRGPCAAGRLSAAVLGLAHRRCCSSTRSPAACAFSSARHVARLDLLNALLVAGGLLFELPRLRRLARPEPLRSGRLRRREVVAGFAPQPAKPEASAGDERTARASPGASSAIDMTVLRVFSSDGGPLYADSPGSRRCSARPARGAAPARRRPGRARPRARRRASETPGYSPSSPAPSAKSLSVVPPSRSPARGRRRRRWRAAPSAARRSAPPSAPGGSRRGGALRWRRCCRRRPPAGRPSGSSSPARAGPARASARRVAVETAGERLERRDGGSDGRVELPPSERRSASRTGADRGSGSCSPRSRWKAQVLVRLARRRRSGRG